LEFLDDRQGFVDVLRGLELGVEDVADYAVAVDYEGYAAGE